MSDKDIKRLSDIAKRQTKAGVTKESAMTSLINAGIITKNGNFTKPYASLSKAVKEA